MGVEYVLIGAGILLLLSIAASKASSALGVPSLLLFLLIGMLAGSEGPGGIHFDDVRVAQSLGIVALVFILFSGGVSTEWSRIRPVVWQGIALSTLGVVLTALLVGLFAVILLGFSQVEGLTLGAIVSSTDAAAVFAVMRSRNVRLTDRLESLLEMESGSNDPMAVFLTVGLLRLLVTPGMSAWGLIPFFVQQMAAGAALGYLFGRGMVLVTNRISLEYDGLYPVLSTTLVILAYAVTSVLGGNGFLAVYLAGLVMGNSTFIHKNSLTNFHDGLAWLMQIAMFLTLGLLVFPSHLLPVAGAALATTLFLMLVARPASVLLVLAPFRLPLPEKAMAAWVGLWGSAPIILATYPLSAGAPRAEMIFNVVFFLVLTSMLIQGPSIPWVARGLRVDVPPPQVAREVPGVPTDRAIAEVLVEIPVPPGSPVAGRPVVELGLPRGVYIVLVQRGEEMVVPGGTTILAAGDVLLMMGDPERLEGVRAVITPAGSSDVDPTREE